ncbi:MULTISPECIES: hypothetical protein [unclassified Luteimonas]
MHIARPLLTTAAVALLVLSATPASAQSAYLDQMSTGPGTCQAALPAFEGQVRKRPLALQNEGTASAFVTCAPPQFTGLADGDYGLDVTFINNGSSAATVSCTGVSIGQIPTIYVSKAISVPSGATRILNWKDTDGSSKWVTSCNLPPGTGIGTVQSYGVSI